MKVDDGVEILELPVNIMGTRYVLYATLIYDNNDMILIDTGYPGQLQEIRNAIEKAGLAFEKLNKIIITHHDMDHTGSLPSILMELPHKAEVMAHSEEKLQIQDEKGIFKLTPEALVRIDATSLPEEQLKAVVALLQNPSKAQITKTLWDGEELPYCGGISVIHTPGHTPGHICLYHKLSKTLIAGDGLTIVDGQLLGPGPQYCLDIETANKSLKKLTKFDIQKVIAYHGGLYRDKTNKRIVELAL